jgi:hypothetical protein
MASAEVGQHRYISVIGSAKRYPSGPYVRSPLDRALARLKRLGTRVLDLKRDGTYWLIKVMA